MDDATTKTQPETHNFGAEVGRLLDLVVHSLYSEREIFLRELVANAADAMDRRPVPGADRRRWRRRGPEDPHRRRTSRPARYRSPITASA